MNTKSEATETPVVREKRKFKKKSNFYMFWIQFRKNKLAVAGLIVFALILLVSATAPLYLDYEKDVVKQDIKMQFQPPSKEHLLGTDHFGRDILSRLLWGSRISIFVGLGVIATALLIGSLLGATAGFFGGIYDDIVMRLLDVFFAIPMTLMAISIVAAFGNSIPNLIVALSLSQIPKLSRIIRSSVITLKSQDFIEAAYACGTSKARIIRRHILPNAVGPIIVEGTLTMGKSIILIAGLSFIGMGVRPPAPEWGAMLSEAKNYMLNYPYLV
jgi:peptide/nickel transport system permease protein